MMSVEVVQPTRQGVATARRPRVAVIGGGIAGLAAAYALTRQLPRAEVVLLERERRLGGKIVTERGDGFVIEGGPESLLVAKPAALALCRELGLGDRLMGTNPLTRRTYILRHGRLCPVPEGLSGMIPTRLWPMVTTRLISPPGKLRMGLDLILPPRSAREDETVAAFIERRLGGEAYRWLVDPLVRGIYAADGCRLSLAATFPQWRQLEAEHGGLIRGTLAAQRMVASPSGQRAASPFQAPRGGLGELVDALAAALRAADARLETGCAVDALRREQDGYSLTLSTGDVLSADAVICATPAHAAADLLAGLDFPLASAMRAIPHASVATISLGYAARDIPRPLNGSGYVTPRAEGRLVNACTWVSTKWEERAPADAALIRVSFGGAGQEELLEASDDRLLDMARGELRDVLGITAVPLLVRLFRWPRAMPQYELGHLARVAAIEARVDAHQGLAVAGNAYRGVGLADCAQSGEQAATRIAAFLAGRLVGATS